MKITFSLAFTAFLSINAFIAVESRAESAVVAKTEEPVEVGGKRIALPAPEGFVQLSGVNALWDDKSVTMVSATNRLLRFFGTPADREALAVGEIPHLQRNFNVQSLRAMEASNIGEADFAALKGQMRTEIVGMKAELGKRINDTLKASDPALSPEQETSLALKVSDTAVIGVFTDTAQGLGFTMAMNLVDGEKKTKRVVACLITTINARILSLYATSDFANATDQQWAETAVQKWHDQIAAANPRVIESVAPTLNLWSVGRAALIGSLLGGLYLLARKLAKRKMAEP